LEESLSLFDDEVRRFVTGGVSVNRDRQRAYRWSDRNRTCS
jgi:hypothetical protein